MPIVDTKIELNNNLSLTTSANGETSLRRTGQDGPHSLPGQARTSLDNAPLKKYLREALLAPNLDKIAPYLWLAFTPDHAHISPLHFQAARGRSIIATEEAYLHLVWYYDRIFIKPLPVYLLSSAFWEYIEETDIEVWQAAAGFMRTYAYLIKFEIDFRKAQSAELGLIPTDDKDPITYERFAAFIAPFAELDDGRVRPRYHYGEMRLTRLNWFARFLLGRLTYHHIHAQWNEYFGRFLAPFLTVFILLSTALSAMQVELAVQSAPQGSGNWDVFSQMCRWVSIIILVLALVVSTLLIFLVLFMFIHEQIFAQKVLRDKRSKQKKFGTSLKSGMV
ncbi:uncharacterized protein PAC_07675 [Phialocephala subalpina]|uniref:Subtilisin-like serine protease n=1 Tax=Phialocephala subalpina TaxID=576137 RepID=A0A1L7WYD8_9HELO|nr:uncharacterized protein PAC_07675 [Phialocephala subalpina]